MKDAKTQYDIVKADPIAFIKSESGPQGFIQSTITTMFFDSDSSGDEEGGDAFDFNADDDIGGGGNDDPRTRIAFLLRETDNEGDTSALHSFIAEDADLAMLTLRLAAETGRTFIAHELLDQTRWCEAITSAPSDFLWIAACLGGEVSIMDRLMTLLPHIDRDLTVTTICSTKHVDALFWLCHRDPHYRDQILSDIDTYLLIAEDADVVGALMSIRRGAPATASVTME